MIDRKRLISQIPIKFLAYGLFLAVIDRLQSPFRKRFQWKVTDVGNSLFPDADLRTFYDAQNIRNILTPFLGGGGKVGRACEIGCGYGRITPVLAEYATNVIGFEREKSLVQMAETLVKDVEIINVAKLADFADKGAFDLIMTCTVLQHLADQECSEVTSLIKKSVNDNGYALIIESTDTTNLSVIGNTKRGDKFLSRPRSESDYIEMMKPLKLVAKSSRELEKNFGSNAGSLMLFQKSAS
jgi:2-polyprenyl-3-methyl-5-hydroxy-6-metoxy-1,4-benzoquinol methylase